MEMMTNSIVERVSVDGGDRYELVAVRFWDRVNGLSWGAGVKSDGMDVWDSAPLFYATSAMALACARKALTMVLSGQKPEMVHP